MAPLYEKGDSEPYFEPPEAQIPKVLWGFYLERQFSPWETSWEVTSLASSAEAYRPEYIKAACKSSQHFTCWLDFVPSDSTLQEPTTVYFRDSADSKMEKATATWRSQFFSRHIVLLKRPTYAEICTGQWTQRVTKKQERMESNADIDRAKRRRNEKRRRRWRPNDLGHAKGVDRFGAGALVHVDSRRLQRNTAFSFLYQTFRINL